jgi:hypothetical protein
VSYLFLASCVVLFFVPLYFVVNQVYQDGVFGRGSLLGISFFSFGILGEASFGVGFYVPSIVVLLIASFAVFLTWHLARFHGRVLKKQGQWKPSSQI